MNLKNFPKRLDSKTSSLRISVPENLDLALEGLIRKVLREQPKADDIYSFAASYFETLLEIRDKTGAKFTAAQLCPFHNDEDAHEMIKLAGTFPKPASKGKPATKSGKPKKVGENSQGKKDVRRSKAKESSKSKKPVEKNKQSTPDLIKKSSTLIESESKSAEEDKKSEKEENEEEFLTSDPIKELVDKELMMEASRKQKTDGKEKTESENTQEEKKAEGKAAEETKLRTQEENEKKQPSNEGNETRKAKAEGNEEITTETGKNKEINKDLKAKNEENKKDKEEKKNKVEEATRVVESKEDPKKINIEDAETRSTEEPTKLEQTKDQPETKTEDKLEKENDSSKQNQTEISRKEEEKSEEKKDSNKPLSESETMKQVTDVPTDKLTPILGEVTRKDEDEPIQDIPEKPKEPSQVINTEPVIENTAATPKLSETEIKKPSEDQQQTNTTKIDTEVPKSVKEEIPSPRTEPDVEKEAINKADIPKDEKEKPKVAQPVNTTTKEPETKQESAKEDSKTILTESESKKNTEAQKPPEQLSENVGNTEEPKMEQKELHKDEIPVLVEQPIETTTRTEDNKLQETEKPDHETATETKADEKTTHGKSEPEDTEAKDKPEKDEADNKTETPNLQLDFNDTTKPKEDKDNLEKKLANEEETNESGEEKPKTEIPQTENVPTETQQKAETEIPANQTSGLNPPAEDEMSSEVQEPTKEKELCTVVDIQHLPKENKMATDEKEIKPELEGLKKEKSTSEELSEVTDVQNIPKMEKTIDEKQKTENTPKEVEPETEELCTVVNNQHLQKQEETGNKKPKAENTQEEVATKRETERSTKKEAVGTKAEEEVAAEKQSKENIQNKEVEAEQKAEENTQTHELELEELCTVVDIHHLPKQEETVADQPKAENKQTEVEAEKPSPTVSNQEAQDEQETLKSQPEGTVKPEPVNSPQFPEDKTRRAAEKPEKGETAPGSITPDHIITVEEAENLGNPEVPSPPTEIQIKTIQTHYYDSLQVPETVTKEYRVHSVETPTAGSLLGVGDVLHRGYEAVQGLAATKAQNPAAVDQNMNSPTEFVESSAISPPLETKTEVIPTEPEPSNAKTDTPTSKDLLKSESDDLLTPTSDYSLNLSELSYQTVHGLFLDSERRYISFEKEETRYSTPKSNTTEKNTENRPEVEEVIEKTIIPANVGAVPMPPREEITEENESTETVKEKKEEKQDGKQPSEGSYSSNGRSEESDVPFISVEVKTVIETQVLDDEDEEKDAERPDVEVKVEARIDIQDDSRNSQSNVEAETEISKEKSEEKLDVKSNSGFQSRSEDDRKGSCSTMGKDGSTGESDSASSAATEIKRTGSGKRNSSSIRGFSSTKSLDFGERNPLVKTRSLSTFRHGVTDFEVWNTLEKELEDAATKIQSKFRGYKTRKKLQRENAVQITTEESSSSTTPAEGDPKEEYQQSTGEFHDSIVLSEHPR